MPILEAIKIKDNNDKWIPRKGPLEENEQIFFRKIPKKYLEYFKSMMPVFKDKDMVLDRIYEKLAAINMIPETIPKKHNIKSELK
jgi:hypothetical protein